MAGDNERLRKYRRRKLRAARTGRRSEFARVSLLYWRYHFRVYGEHVRLWTQEL